MVCRARWRRLRQSVPSRARGGTRITGGKMLGPVKTGCAASHPPRYCQHKQAQLHDAPHHTKQHNKRRAGAAPQRRRSNCRFTKTQTVRPTGWYAANGDGSDFAEWHWCGHGRGSREVGGDGLRFKELKAKLQIRRSVNRNAFSTDGSRSLMPSCRILGKTGEGTDVVLDVFYWPGWRN